MITLQQSNQLKSIAILMMLGLHLFNRDYHGLFTPLLFIGHQPLSYYVSLFCDACVPIFAFVSGYGLYFKYRQNAKSYQQGNWMRLKKLYLNYWVVLLLFAVILGWVLGKERFPGSLLTFVLNMTGLDPSYNGAWWFFTTYVFFVLTSGFWFSMLERLNPYVFFVALMVVYVIAFYFRIYKTEIFANPILNWGQRQMVLYFCTLFQFMLGGFALKYDWHGRLSNLISSFRYKNVWALLIILSALISHALVPNFIVAPFTGLVFIMMFSQLRLSNTFNGILNYFSPHATNLWLIHMFFYMIYFKDFVYSFRYVPLIFTILVALCLLSSYIVNSIIKQINRIL